MEPADRVAMCLVAAIAHLHTIAFSLDASAAEALRSSAQMQVLAPLQVPLVHSSSS